MSLTISVREDTMIKMKVIGYWTATIGITFELAVGGVAALVHGRTMLFGPPLVETMQHLGYPVYFLTILGSWKVLGAIALLVPRFPRLKEWAYAGTFINMTAAIASHLIRGDGVDALIWPLIFAVLTIASWALRPQSRTLGVIFPAQSNQTTQEE